MHSAFALNQVIRPTAVAIGNFDGIHLGHQQVLHPILAASAGIKTVLTFHPHPREVLKGESRPLLTPPDEKRAYLKTLGFEQVVQLPFTRDFAQQPPQSFLDDVLTAGLHVQQLSVGWDFCFGYKRSGNTELLKTWGQTRGIPVHIVPQLQRFDDRVSSSRIRQALEDGSVTLATQLLGRPYDLNGVVVQGDQRGRELGFPTANVVVPTDKYLPRDGVYSCWVWIPGVENQQAAVMNIGNRPTFAGLQRTIEVHVLNWCGDLYDLRLRIQLMGFIRPERKFDSLSALVSQIQEDCQTAQAQLGCEDPAAGRLVTLS